jgi:hypothetical protein
VLARRNRNAVPRTLPLRTARLSRVAAVVTACASGGACANILGIDHEYADRVPGAGGQFADGAGGSAPTGGGAGSTISSSSGMGGSGTSSTSSSGSCGTLTILPTNLIDDMAAGTASILPHGGRIGSWYTYDDGTAGAVQTPAAFATCTPALIPGGYCGSTHAQHTSGSGFTTWGAGIGFDFNGKVIGSPMPYDVSAFTGIVFSARGTPAVRFMVTAPATIPVAQGGSCTTKCSDSFGTSIALSSAWEQYAIPFSSLKQIGWGTKVAFDLTTALSVLFQVAQNQSFDFWITDVGFY